MKKLRAPQGRRQKISDEALRLWRSCLALERQGAPKRFRGEYQALGRKLATECGLDWCGMQWPTNCTSATLPAYLRGRELQTADYWAAYRARLALIEAEAAADREAEAENEQRPGPTT